MNFATGLALGTALSQPVHWEPPLWLGIGLVLLYIILIGLALYMMWESFK